MGQMCLSLTAILANCVNMLLIGPVKIQQNIKSKSHLKNKEQLHVTRACLLKTPELVIRRFKTRIYSGLCGCTQSDIPLEEIAKLISSEAFSNRGESCAIMRTASDKLRECV